MVRNENGNAFPASKMTSGWYNEQLIIIYRFCDMAIN